ncbi:MAG: lysozyme M1 (1,4-beta-N-acetylmuramidase) [Acidimicrobiia bacterium]|nr:lysozyme M1 (1,4-beta-N-acetylmuramidase) [Acidimicrobiia bacterium]
MSAEVERNLRGRRRWPWIVGASVLVIAVLAAVVWFLWLPQYRPSLHEGERYGIDVSNHQGTIDWEQVAADNIDFTYIKATEGGDHTDASFARNWRAADRAGLERGAYHFFTLCTPGLDQARHFLSVVREDPGSLPPAVDLELAGNCRARPSASAVRKELTTFVGLVERTTRQPMLLYIGDDFERRYPVREQLSRSLWHLRVLRRPNVERWLVWQVMGFAHVEGVGGHVDLDVMAARR